RHERGKRAAGIGAKEPRECRKYEGKDKERGGADDHVPEDRDRGRSIRNHPPVLREQYDFSDFRASKDASDHVGAFVDDHPRGAYEKIKRWIPESIRPDVIKQAGEPHNEKCAKDNNDERFHRRVHRDAHATVYPAVSIKKSTPFGPVSGSRFWYF